MIKSSYKKEEIEKFVSNKLVSSIKLLPVVEGMDSQVYSYTFKDKEYIIRINSNIEGFKKDEYAYNHFNSDIIPIPKIIDYGKYNDSHYYCISEKANGITYEDSPEEVVVKLLPDITKIKLAINDIDISNTTGYGIFDSETGNAQYNTWKDYLKELSDRNWDEIKKFYYVDNDLVDELLEKYNSLLDYVKEERKLLHGDFGNNNIIVEEGKRFSAVIDWDCAGYGDPLKTVASSYFWSTWLMCADRVWNYWKEIYKDTPNFDKIMTCYAIRSGLSEIYDNSLDHDLKNLNWIQGRCKEILKR